MLPLLLSATAVPQTSEAETAPQFFVEIAADIAGNVQPADFTKYVGIYVGEKIWADAAKDSDLGPFLKSQTAKPGRSAALLFSADKNAAVCVFFDGRAPYGVIAVRGEGGIKPADIAAGYKTVSKDMLKKSGPKLRFTPQSGINTDDGVELTAFVISADSKSLTGF